MEASFKNKEKVKLMISFDSCGWLYMYHFGVALWIEERFGRATYENILGVRSPYSEYERLLHAEL